MELIPGNRYRVTDKQGNCFVMMASSSRRLKMVRSYLVGLVGRDLEFLIISLDDFDESDLTIEPLEDQPAQASPPAISEQAREAILLELLQAITAGVYARQPYGDQHFDPAKSIVHIQNRLRAFRKEPQQ